ncbi:MAG: T9SS type A sorting domain-containing protein, partial [Bacteroidales bacterium]|nr:T9SS type A sorting domain-containing protein [Bacteroidales bacterium]
GGLAQFDGINWTIYNTTNSGLPDNGVMSIAIDGNGNKWIGTSNGGLAKFDGINWTIYNTTNSGLPNNHVLSIVNDGNGYKWIGTYAGLTKFDGVNWTTHNTSNSGLPDNVVNSIEIDESGNKWIGTNNGGLAKYDESSWTTYNKANSGLPSNYIESIAMDINENIWLVTDAGLVVFNENGVHFSVYENQFTQNFISVYPNPTIDKLYIQIDIFIKSTVEIFNLCGKRVHEMNLQGGENIVDLGHLAPGVYIARIISKGWTLTKKILIQ